MSTNQWSLDKVHSELSFKIKHLMISNVTGVFSNFDVQTSIDEDDLTKSTISATIQVTSIDTKNEQRDGHLRTSDFFDAETYPTIDFQSTSIEKTDNENYQLNGHLTMKGHSHPVTLHVEYSGLAKDPFGNVKAGFTVTGKISRALWGMNYNAALETGGVLLSDDVKIGSEIQLLKVAEVIA